METTILQNSAVLLANLFLLTSDVHAQIIHIKDDISSINEQNIILLGTEKCIVELNIDRKITLDKEEIELGNCKFSGGNHSALYITTHGKDNLMLVLTAHEASAIQKYLITLAIPTIPPMTRSPFSNLIPDYVIVSPDILSKGPGGYLCTGFWDNSWNYDGRTSSCDC